MDPLSTAAAGGLRSRMESLDMLSNNLANAGTGGFKSDREFFSLYFSPDATDPLNNGADTVPVIERHWIDYSQGVLRDTGNATDFALQGNGFFTVKGPRGLLYTRNGNFRVSAAGVLTTSDGYPVQMTDGAPVTLQSNGPLQVNAQGDLAQDGQPLGRLALALFEDPQAVNKQGSNYFYLTDTQARTAASTAEVQQGHLEDSNTGPAEGAVQLVNVMRQFEMLQKALTLGEEMNKRAVEEVARVS